MKGAVWGYGVALIEKVSWTLRVHSLPISSLLSVLMVEDMSSKLPAPATTLAVRCGACLPCLPTTPPHHAACTLPRLGSRWLHAATPPLSAGLLPSGTVTPDKPSP